MGHAPSLLDKASVLAEILRPRHRRASLHFFFTPNAITSRVLRALRTVTPRRVLIQTITSSHQLEAHVPHLRGLDAVVALSDHSAQRLVAAGLAADRVHRIYPGVSIPPAPAGAPPKVALYAGDLDVAVARRLVRCARAFEQHPDQDWRLVIACRPKSPEDPDARALLRRELGSGLDTGRVELHGAVPNFEALLTSCGYQLFVADHVRNKVDLPLVILEGLSRGLGLVALDFAPVNEIFEIAARERLTVGARITAADDDGFAESFMASIPDAATLARWRTDAHALASAAFSAKILASAYQTLYSSLHGRQ